MKDCWDILDDTVEKIGEFYGLVVNKDCKQRVFREILKNLLDDAKGRMHDMKFKANCVDGVVREGYIEDSEYLILLENRDKENIELDDMSLDKYRNMLLKSDRLYTYCQDDEKLYRGIKPVIGRYIMRHNLSKNIIYVILNNLAIPEITCGNSAEIFGKYLKMERSLNAKKDMFMDEISKTLNKRYINDPVFPLYYLIETMHKRNKENRYYRELDKSYIESLVTDCEDLSISAYDAITRCKLGCTREQAIQMGLEDSAKYGFVSDTSRGVLQGIGEYNHVYDGHTYNFVEFIERIALQEEKELGLKYE